jgi:hypothetical protein
MPLHCALGRLQRAGDEVEQRRLARAVLAHDGDARVHVDTEREALVQVVLDLAAVREGHLVERNDGRRQLAHILELEAQRPRRRDGLDEAGGLHLVDNLLLRLGLLDQVGVRTGTGDELLDVLDLVLLLGVRLHLVRLVLRLRAHVRRVVAAVVHELLVVRQVHDVGADRVHEVGRVRREDENVVVRREVRLEPHDGLEVQVVRRLVEQQQVRLDEEGTRKRHAHAPATGQVLGRLVHHRLGEAETVQNGTGLGLERRRVELLELLVLELEAHLVDLVGDGHDLDLLFETRHLLLGRLDAVLEAVLLRRLDLALHEVELHTYPASSAIVPHARPLALPLTSMLSGISTSRCASASSSVVLPEPFSPSRPYLQRRCVSLPLAGAAARSTLTAGRS